MSKKVIVNGMNIGYLPPTDASEINYTRGGVTTTVEQVLNNVLYKDEANPTIKGALYVDKANGTTTTDGYSAIVIGNDKQSGTEGNSTGNMYLYSNTDKCVVIHAPSNLSGNKSIILPNLGGTLALTSQIPSITYAGTLSGDVLSVCKNLPNESVNFYINSNKPDNRATNCDWGSYLIFKSNDACSLLYWDFARIAFTYSVTDSAQSISTWKVLS